MINPRSKNNEWGSAGSAMPLALLLGFGTHGVASVGLSPIGNVAASAETTSINRSILDAIDGNANARAEATYDEMVSASPEVIASNELRPELQIISPLGQRLLAIRSRIVESGTPLLDWDEVATEKEKMRRDR